MITNTSHSDEDDYPKAMLIEPDEWSRKNGYLSQLRVMHNPSQSSSIHLTPEGLQAIVDHAYAQHGISASEAVAKELDRLGDTLPRCDCYPGGFTPDSFEGPKEDCPVHGRRAHLTDEDMSDLDNRFSPGLSSGMARFDLVESLIRREIAKELERLADQDGETFTEGIYETAFTGVRTEEIEKRAEAIRNG